VRLDDQSRQDLEKLRRLTLNLPAGGQVPLSAVADIRRGSGPNTINRENVRRRIVVHANTAERDLGRVVAEIQQRLAPIDASLPSGYFIEYGGQFESQQSATRMIGLLSLISLAAMFGSASATDSTDAQTPANEQSGASSTGPRNSNDASPDPCPPHTGATF